MLGPQAVTQHHLHTYSNLNIGIFKFECWDIQILISGYSNLNIGIFKFEYWDIQTWIWKWRCLKSSVTVKGGQSVGRCVIGFWRRTATARGARTSATALRNKPGRASSSMEESCTKEMVEMDWIWSLTNLGKFAIQIGCNLKDWAKVKALYVQRMKSTGTIGAFGSMPL